MFGEGFGEALDVGHELAFVVGGATTVDAAVADGGFEGGGEPLVEGFGGLDVVVAVEEDGAAAGEVFVFGDEDGVAGGLMEVGGEAEGGEAVLEPEGAGAGVIAMSGAGGDAGEAEEGEEVFEAGGHGSVFWGDTGRKKGGRKKGDLKPFLE